MMQEQMLRLRVRGDRTMPAEKIRKLLIRGTNWIGDAVMTLPAMASIRETFPAARISVLAKPWVADVYRLCSHVDDIFTFESPGRHDGITGKFRLAAEIKGKNFDAAILLQNAIEAAIIACLARIPIRAGYDSDARGFLLTHAVKRTPCIKEVHQTHYYLEMVKALGCRDTGIQVRLEPRAEDRERAEAILNTLRVENTPLVGLAPGATYGAAKKWYPERFAAIADRLAEERNARILLFGSKADEGSTQDVAKHAHYPLIDLAGKTSLRDAMAVMARCALFISNDSGLMHVAAALGVPVIAIFGSTNPITTGPVGSKSIIIQKKVACSPCLKTTCPTDFRCMDMIQAEDVYQAAKQLITAPS